MRWGLAVSATGQTGQSEAIHSPEAWASMVVKLTTPDAWSMAVVCTVAISCCPSVLRTISWPRPRRAPPPIHCTGASAASIIRTSKLTAPAFDRLALTLALGALMVQKGLPGVAEERRRAEGRGRSG